jgi:hypothetical protein
MGSAEWSFSAPTRIKVRKDLSHLSLISIKKALVADLKPNTYDQVIEKLVAMDKRAEFCFLL